MNKGIGCIGCGNMGGAILSGLACRAPIWEGMHLFGFNRTPGRLEPLEAIGVTACATPADLAREARFVILAVKPPQIEDMIRAILPELTPDHVLISVAAGVGVEALRSASEGRCGVVRCMPNTPARVGRGVFALCFDDPALTPEAQDAVGAIFSALGRCLEIPEEKMTAFSALVGAGPAYVFTLMQAMVQAGATLGFTWAQSREMVVGLFDGCAQMAEASGDHLTKMSDDVCSPRGLTIAGINSLQRAGVPGALIDAVLAADARGREMER